MLAGQGGWPPTDPELCTSAKEAIFDFTRLTPDADLS